MFMGLGVGGLGVFFGGGFLQNRMFVKDYLFSKGGEKNDEVINH
jgi:hypothetical protein